MKPEWSTALSRRAVGWPSTNRRMQMTVISICMLFMTRQQTEAIRGLPPSDPASLPDTFQAGRSGGGSMFEIDDTFSTIIPLSKPVSLLIMTKARTTVSTRARFFWGSARIRLRSWIRMPCDRLHCLLERPPKSDHRLADNCALTIVATPIAYGASGVQFPASTSAWGT